MVSLRIFFWNFNQSERVIGLRSNFEFPNYTKSHKIMRTIQTASCWVDCNEKKLKWESLSKADDNGSKVMTIPHLAL